MTDKKAKTAAADKTATKTDGDAITGVTKAVPMPEIVSKRGSKSKYPFDQLTEVGMSFGVKGRTAQSLASVVSSQNRKHKQVKTDENGNTVYETITRTNPDGTKLEVPNTDKPVTEVLKKFYAADVDAKTDPDGASVRVFRSV